MKKVFLIAIITSSGIFAVQAQQPSFTVDSSKYSAYWWHSKDMYDHLPDTKNEIIFLGNSITDGAEWFELFSNPRCHNRGISADVTEGVLLRLDAITKLDPSKIFIMIGINDLSRDMTVDEIIANYRTILERIRKETPRTKVYVESVLPVNPATGMALNHTNKTGLIMQLNGRLRGLSEEFGHTFIDLFAVMADENNQLPRKYSIDGLHLSYEGYRIWVEAIKQYVK
jgi:lysophospholipase L1-like esterase